VKKKDGMLEAVALKKNRIYQGDCVEVLRRASDSFVDLTITSPPYDSLRDYEGYVFNFKGIAKELYRVTKLGGVVIWIVADATIKGSETGTSFRQALYFKKIGFDLNDTMIWNKGSFTAVGALRKRYAQTFEYMFIFTKGSCKTFNPIKDRKNKVIGKMGGSLRLRDGTMRKMSTNGKIRAKFGQRFAIWKQPPCGGNKTGHPAPFPEKLIEDHIISWSNKGDTILDPMCGSGTTCKMAKKMKRNYIGIDCSKKYCKIAKARVERIESE